MDVGCGFSHVITADCCKMQPLLAAAAWLTAPLPPGLEERCAESSCRSPGPGTGFGSRTDCSCCTGGSGSRDRGSWADRGPSRCSTARLSPLQLPCQGFVVRHVDEKGPGCSAARSYRKRG